MSAEMTSQNPTPEDEKPQETDADVLKRDVIYVKSFKLYFLWQLFMFHLDNTLYKLLNFHISLYTDTFGELRAPKL